MTFKFKEPRWLQRIHAPSWVVLILGIIFVFRIPSFFEPYYYGDEMIYLNLGGAIKRGMVLYRDIHDNKPPLLYLLAAVSGNVFWFRAMLAGWMMITTIFFWRLCQALFPKNEWLVKSSTVSFAFLTTLPLLEGQIANAELFMIGPTIISFYLLLTKKLTNLNLLLAGVLLSISTLFKVPAAFDAGAIVFLWIVTIKIRRQEIQDIFRKIFFLAIGFTIPLVLSFAWYFARGAFSEYLTAAFLQNFGYLSSWRPESVAEPFVSKNGPLLLRAIIVGIGALFLFMFRKKLSWQFVFISGWLLFSLFAATLSERPYPHYLIQVVPAISLLIGTLLASRSSEQSFSVIPLFLVIAAVIRFQFWYYPSTPYYQRFISYVSGQTNREEYANGFDKNTTRNYEIANYIRSSTQPSENVFVWGDSPTIYALADRLPPIKYVATYHIMDFSTPAEVSSKIQEAKPKIIVTLPEAQKFAELEVLLQRSYILLETIKGAKIWKFSEALSRIN